MINSLLRTNSQGRQSFKEELMGSFIQSNSRKLNSNVLELKRQMRISFTIFFTNHHMAFKIELLVPLVTKI
jgi:hypothetical protein